MSTWSSFVHWGHWGSLIGLCWLCVAILSFYVATHSYRRAKVDYAPPSWPLHGRYVTTLLLFTTGLAALDVVRIRLALSGTLLYLAGPASFYVFIIRFVWLLVLLWFVNRWRTGTILSFPGPSMLQRFRSRWGVKWMKKSR